MDTRTLPMRSTRKRPLYRERELAKLFHLRNAMVSMCTTVAREIGCGHQHVYKVLAGQVKSVPVQEALLAFGKKARSEAAAVKRAA